MNTTRDLLEQAMHLPLAERAKLIDALLESMHDADPVVDAKWVLEARARLAAYRAGELKAIDADEVLKNLRA